jgi:hypothetical protein
MSPILSVIKIVIIGKVITSIKVYINIVIVFKHCHIRDLVVICFNSFKKEMTV